MSRWTVTEIKLEAHYIGHDPDRLTVPCQSISLREARYTKTVAADGGVQRSEVEPESLLASGIDLKALQTITWKPNLLLFKDSVTGEQKEFPITFVDTCETDIAKFIVNH
jgi:hypothetical protein